VAEVPLPRRGGEGRVRGERKSMNLVGSTYVTGFMMAKGYFASFVVLP
jgi:hypothetical protein